MSDKFSRRDFLKLAGVGAATTAVLTGCGPASRYVKREPYMQMPEYTYNGQSTYYAPTCRECAAGCGLARVRRRVGAARICHRLWAHDCQSADHPVLRRHLRLGRVAGHGFAVRRFLHRRIRGLDAVVDHPYHAGQPVGWAVEAAGHGLDQSLVRPGADRFRRLRTGNTGVNDRYEILAPNR